MLWGPLYWGWHCPPRPLSSLLHPLCAWILPSMHFPLCLFRDGIVPRPLSLNTLHYKITLESTCKSWEGRRSGKSIVFLGFCPVGQPRRLQGSSMAPSPKLQPVSWIPRTISPLSPSGQSGDGPCLCQPGILHHLILTSLSLPHTSINCPFIQFFSIHLPNGSLKLPSTSLEAD